MGLEIEQRAMAQSDEEEQPRYLILINLSFFIYFFPNCGQ